MQRSFLMIFLFAAFMACSPEPEGQPELDDTVSPDEIEQELLQAEPAPDAPIKGKLSSKNVRIMMKTPQNVWDSFGYEGVEFLRTQSPARYQAARERFSHKLAAELDHAPQVNGIPQVSVEDFSPQELMFLGYEIFIDIDKAAKGEGAQRMRVYQDGELVYTWKVSTGAETPAVTKGTKVTTARKTPVGFFRPIPGRLFRKYHSSTWDADMPFAMFFSGGIAIHGTHPSHYKELGSRASGGCVRLHQDNASTLFSLVRDEAARGTIAEISEDGVLVLDRAQNPKAIEGYRTLILIRNGNVPVWDTQEEDLRDEEDLLRVRPELLPVQEES